MERSSWETLGENGKHMENNMENEWKNMRKNMTHEKNICYGKINGTRYMETIIIYCFNEETKTLMSLEK